MRKWLFIAPLSLLFACGDSETPVVAEEVNLDEYSDRIGYVLGALNAESILQSGGKMNELNKELLIDGFSNNLNDKDCSDCDDVILGLFGPYGQDFDTTKIDAGSTCIGRLTGFRFYTDMVGMGGSDKINMEMVKVGFRHGMYEADTLIDETEKRTMVQNFIADVNSLNGEKMIEAAKKEPGAQVFDNDIVMFTLEEGNGAYPDPKDDVEVEYILTNAFGDTVQSSYEMKKMNPDAGPVYLSLNGGVIAGWSFVIPKMRVGGKASKVVKNHYVSLLSLKVKDLKVLWLKNSQVCNQNYF
jgi:hypothetical protein